MYEDACSGVKLRGMRYNYSRETNNVGRAKLNSIVAAPLWQRGANLSVALRDVVLWARDDKHSATFWQWLTHCVWLGLGTSGK